MLKSHLELNFDVLHAAIGNKHADGDNIRLVNLGPIAFFNNHKLTTSSGKHLEEINHAHIVSLMYKLLSSSKGSHDWSNGFERSCDRRQREFTINKNIKGTHHVRFYLKDIFGFAEHQETATYGLGYKLLVSGNTDNAALSKSNATNNAIFKINALERYVPHYRVSLEEYKIRMDQITKKTPATLNYSERSVFKKRVKSQKFRTFVLGVQEGFNVPLWIFVVFQQSDRQHDQNLNNDTFHRMPVTSAQVVIGT